MTIVVDNNWIVEAKTAKPNGDNNIIQLTIIVINKAIQNQSN